MTPEVAEELNGVVARTGDAEPLDPADVLRAITAGVRRSGAVAVGVAELDAIAAEMGGPPWP